MHFQFAQCCLDDITIASLELVSQNNNKASTLKFVVLFFESISCVSPSGRPLADRAAAIATEPSGPRAVYKYWAWFLGAFVSAVMMAGVALCFCHRSREVRGKVCRPNHRSENRLALRIMAEPSGRYGSAVSSRCRIMAESKVKETGWPDQVHLVHRHWKVVDIERAARGLLMVLVFPEKNFHVH